MCFGSAAPSPAVHVITLLNLARLLPTWRQHRLSTLNITVIFVAFYLIYPFCYRAELADDVIAGHRLQRAPDCASSVGTVGMHSAERPPYRTVPEEMRQIQSDRFAWQDSVRGRHDQCVVDAHLSRLVSTARHTDGAESNMQAAECDGIVRVCGSETATVGRVHSS